MPKLKRKPNGPHHKTVEKLAAIILKNGGVARLEDIVPAAGTHEATVRKQLYAMRRFGLIWNPAPGVFALRDLGG